MTAVASRPTRSSSFDRENWPPTAARLVSAAALLAFAVAAAAIGGFGRLIGALIVVDIAAGLLPWRFPRSARTAASIWTEALLYLLAPMAMVVAAAGRQAGWAWQAPRSPWWWLVAVAVGAGLIAVGGMPLRRLLRGELAFLAGPLPRRHKWARSTSTVAAPPGEELLFRAPVLLVSGPAVLGVGLLGAVAFVARHHLPTGLHQRTSSRVMITQITAAGSLLALTVAAHSVLPAILAHYLNNVPGLVLELGRPV